VVFGFSGTVLIPDCLLAQGSHGDPPLRPFGRV
jgi:hypothetical protein